MSRDSDHGPQQQQQAAANPLQLYQLELKREIKAENEEYERALRAYNRVTPESFSGYCMRYDAFRGLFEEDIPL